MTGPKPRFTFRARPIYLPTAVLIVAPGQARSALHSPLFLSNDRAYWSAGRARRAGIVFAETLARQAEETADLKLSYVRVSILDAGDEVDSLAVSRGARP